MGEITYRDRNVGKYDKNGKRKKQNWEYRFEIASVNGKRKWKAKSGFQRKQDAMAAAAIAYSEYLNGGEVVNVREISFSDVLDNWIEEYCKLQLADETVKNYEKRIRAHIKPALGSYRVSSLSTHLIQRFLNELVRKQYSRNTIVSIKGIISKALKYAKRMKWVVRNEALEVELPSWNASRRLRSKLRVPLTREVVNEIFARFPEGHSCYTPLLFGYRAGTRIGESFAFLWDDIDFENGQIDVNKQVQWYKERQQWRFVPPKYDSYRKIDMDRDTMAYLKRERQRQLQFRQGFGEAYIHLYRDSDGYIGTSGNGEEIQMVTVRNDGSYIQPRVMQHCSHVVHKELGHPAFDFHTLRHTHATELEEAGVSSKEIQRRLGHKSEMTTRRVYVHATDEMRKQSIEILNSMYQADDHKIGT